MVSLSQLTIDIRIVQRGELCMLLRRPLQWYSAGNSIVSVQLLRQLWSHAALVHSHPRRHANTAPAAPRDAL